ncbi:transglycosylase SLT domain-containing protein [Psychromonas antarctica]|uniref:transglycosylase SLT domain-containing protein n=1 Tax=Psychromonas antarctica TaxID=67573 RepID=UPI001EE9A338|nr:transglycosylase SLT domain-containing protein [Psychromonas antarctica]MCG6200190.1 transglycosylase SLT domain-containing protein [Psychromonas antarctica]
MKKIFVLCLCLLSSCSFSTVLPLSQQRQIYAKTAALQERQLWEEAAQNAALIPQYPLTYLLDYQYIKAHFDRNSLSAVQSFINHYSRRKVSSDLQRDYLYYLADNQYWPDFLRFYPHLPNSLDLKCFHFQAQMAQGGADKIWPLVQETWLTGYSLPNACDSVLDYYLDNHKISSALIWQRFQLAYIHNQTSLSAYLLTLMDKKSQLLARQLLQLRRSPEKLLSSKLFQEKEQASYSFLLIGIKRLAQKEISLGINAYLAYDKKIPFTLFEKISLKKYFISRILIRNETSLLSWSDKELLDLGDQDLIEQRIRYAIKLDNWVDIEFWLTQLSLPMQQDNKWLYWQARVLENKQQPEQANKLYRQIATERTFYGFFAAQKLGLAYQFNAQLVTATLDNLEALQPQLAHIEELHFNKLQRLLKREWQALLGNQSYHAQRQLGLYAFQKGWAHLSVVASIHSKSWDALNIRFPQVDPDLFLSAAKKYQLEPTYIYAITRQESSFDEFAYSPVGARGYMQLMPGTAIDTARKIGLTEYKARTQLNQGYINVQLGTAYFDFLVKRYNGNRILATAAYNAGPNRVDRWQGNKKGRAEQGLRMDSWIETIPYKETRRYVKNVLAYNLIYQHILDKPLELLTPTELDARF